MMSLYSGTYLMHSEAYVLSDIPTCVTASADATYWHLQDTHVSASFVGVVMGCFHTLT